MSLHESFNRCIYTGHIGCLVLSELAPIDKFGKNIVVERRRGELLQYLTFKLIDETYDINVMQVKEVLRYIEIAPVPGLPYFVLGIVNLRGNIVDTCVHFSLSECTISDDTRIIVVEHDGEQVKKYFTYIKVKLSKAQGWVMMKHLYSFKVYIKKMKSWSFSWNWTVCLNVIMLLALKPFNFDFRLIVID